MRYSRIWAVQLLRGQLSICGALNNYSRNCGILPALSRHVYLYTLKSFSGLRKFKIFFFAKSLQATYGTYKITIMSNDLTFELVPWKNYFSNKVIEEPTTVMTKKKLAKKII